MNIVRTEPVYFFLRYILNEVGQKIYESQISPLIATPVYCGKTKHGEIIKHLRALRLVEEISSDLAFSSIAYLIEVMAAYRLDELFPQDEEPPFDDPDELNRWGRKRVRRLAVIAYNLMRKHGEHEMAALFKYDFREYVCRCVQCNEGLNVAGWLRELKEALQDAVVLDTPSC